MDVVFEAARTDAHFEQILQLQRQNLASALGEERKAQDGFVFAEHNIPLLKEMALHLPQVVALRENRVVAYNLAMTPFMKHSLPSLVPMFDEFERCRYKGRPLADYPFMIGGQVCVARDFRGQGLLKRLYQETANRLPGDYRLCVTEIDVENAVSRKAHEKMGFQAIHTYHDGGTQWTIVAWEFPPPASIQSSGPR